MQEHIDIHAGWLAPVGPQRRPVYLLPRIETVTDDVVGAFAVQMTQLTRQQSMVLRARVAGMSIPEIAAAQCITVSAVKDHTNKALRRLGLNTGHAGGRVTRAAYLIGRLDCEV
jgi:DNA-binding NarL/FixJ family response regulator